MTLGHLAVVPVGNVVVAFDAVHGTPLWQKNLLDPALGPAASETTPRSLTVDPRDGSVQIAYDEGWKQHLGRIGPLEGAAVCVQMRDALAAVDPVNGRLLWTRSDVNPASHIFGDDKHLFVVEMSENGKSASTRVFRTYDGSTVAAPDFHQVYEDRIRLVGRDILTADKDRDATTLRLYDPLTGKDVWKQAFAAKSFVLQGDECGLGGVIEPDGRVRVVDLASGREISTAKTGMDAKGLDKDTTYTILADALDVYVAPDAPPPPLTRVNSNLMPGAGLRGLNVNGDIYAFRRDTGARHWVVTASDVQLVLDRFAEMPMLVMTGQTQKYNNIALQPAGQPKTSLIIVDKGTGKRCKSLEPNNTPPDDNFTGGPFYGLEVNSRAGTIEFTGPQDRISIGPAASKPSPPSEP
jgi:outer membrane protein assembly factor BamB